MDKKKTAEEHTPDSLQRTFQKTVEKLQERRGYYATAAIVLFIAVLAGLLYVNWEPERDAGLFPRIWDRFQASKGLLDADRSAVKPLAELEELLPQARDTSLEAYTLWLLAIGNYREAMTPEKVTDSQRRPFLEKAAGFLDQLGVTEGEKFDDRLLAIPTWFGRGPDTPIDQLRAQLEADLKWSSSASYVRPTPREGLVAVLRTELGDIHLQFYEELAPIHTKHFLTLALLGAYNGTAFDYVYGGRTSPRGIRGGDPYTFFYNDPLKKEHIKRWGLGGLGVEQPPEKARGLVQHEAGTVSSLRDPEGDWDNAIVFRIATDRDREQDRRNTPFAVVVEGMDVVNRIATERKLAGEHSTYKDSAEFLTLTRRSLLVEPVLIHKVIVYRDGVADSEAHKFPLEEAERKISSLSAAPAVALPEDVIYGGRSLLDIDAATGETKPQFGLNFPFPRDLSAPNRAPDKEPPSPKGERTKNLVKPRDTEKRPDSDDSGDSGDSGD